jgi:hypothetical protein
MNTGYPFMPDDGKERESAGLKWKVKAWIAGVLTALQAGETAYAAVKGTLHDLKLLATILIWCVLAIVWYSITRDKKP